ncbi:hypothetical protein DEH69_22780 [Streptomyces sp. PT12]|nr:hypothetical protein DEH69_22780 [Streptomyces sp. PT12]
MEEVVLTNSPRQDAECAMRELRVALEARGIAFPVVRLHTCVPDAPLVELGRVRPETARALARALVGELSGDDRVRG